MSIARLAAALSVSAASAGAKPGGWFVYVVETKSGKLYSGISVDVKRRIEQHCDAERRRQSTSRRPARASPVRGDRGGPLRGDEA